MRITTVFLILLSISFLSAVTTFTDINANLTGLINSDINWGDYDNDGYLDILETGYGTTYTSKIYHNNGNGTFTDINAGLPGAYYSNGVWGDYDNDGYLDFVLSGELSSSGTKITRIYHNNHNGTFTDINAGLPGVIWGTTVWGDYDNDGHLDLLISGAFDVAPWFITRIYHNNGNGTFTDIVANLPGINNSAVGHSIAWGDYDNDGDLDILMAGEPHNQPFITRIYRNDNGVFTDLGLNLPGVAYGASVAWGDYDNDGNLDFIINGYNSASGTYPTNIYHNNGNGTFTNIAAGLQAMYEGSVAWGDYDNDGLSDVFITGRDISSNYFGKIYHNNGAGIFSAFTGTLPISCFGRAQWGDYNNDGALDFAITGSNLYTYASKIYRNDGSALNTPPAAPTNLSTSVSGDYTVFHWNASTDTQTPALGLSYMLRIGSTSGGCDIVSPAASATGYRRQPVLGYAGSACSWQIKTSILDAYPSYYWSVQAIDNGLEGSPFSTEMSSASVAVPTNVVVSLPTVEMLQLHWTAVPGASSYEVYASLNPYTSFPSGWTLLGTTNTASFHSADLSNSKRFYRIVAVSGAK